MVWFVFLILNFKTKYYHQTLKKRDMNYQEFPEEVKGKVEGWLQGNYDQDTKNTMKILKEENPDELFDGFYKSLSFGTAGLRGVMGVGPNRMNRYTVGMSTQGLANYVKEYYAGLKALRVIIAYDCRHNGELFAKTAAKILIANGISAFLFEALRPTPELSFAVRHFSAQAGIVITASHNPKEYNGYKVYWDDGGQIISPHDKNLIKHVGAITNIDDVKWDGNEKDIQYLGEEFDRLYLDKVKSLSLSPEIIRKNKDMKIVFTPIHGTGVKLVPESLQNFGFENIIHVPEQDVVDGDFPTVESPNPEERVAMEMAIKKAEETDADLIMATDPDADRVGVGVKNNKGRFVLLNGNQTASLLCYYMMHKWSENGKLAGKEFIVKTIVTTELLVDIAKKYKVDYYDVLTGFKYIGGIIKENEGKKQFIVGGEESYGYLAGDFVRDKDAVISASLIAETAAWARENGKSMFELLLDIYLEFGMYLESMSYIVKKGKTGAEEIQKMMHDFRHSPPNEINGSQIVMIKDYQEQKIKYLETGKEENIDLPVSNVLQFFLEDETKISVRPSGTEPKIKFYIAVKASLASRDDFDDVSVLLSQKIKDIGKSLGI